jgi:hypothetical protein
MFPHADTIYTINALDHEQKVRLADRERLAASAQADMHPPVIMPASVHRVAATLFGGLVKRWGSAHRVRPARPLLMGGARAADLVS